VEAHPQLRYGPESLHPPKIGGRYCEDCHVAHLMPDNVPIDAITEGVRGYALDANNAEALWKKSEEMVGESF
jgi:hypothetical protein